jgi:hypothetical protein
MGAGNLVLSKGMVRVMREPYIYQIFDITWEPETCSWMHNRGKGKNKPIACIHILLDKALTRK